MSALNGVLQFLTDFFMIRTSYKSLCDQILTYLFMVHMLLAYNCDQLLPSQCVTIAARLMMFFFMASALVLNHLCFEISQAQDVHNFLFQGELFTYLSTDRLKVIISFCHCCHMILRGKGMWEARNTYNISIDFDVMVWYLHMN